MASSYPWEFWPRDATLELFRSRRAIKILAGLTVRAATSDLPVTSVCLKLKLARCKCRVRVSARASVGVSRYRVRTARLRAHKASSLISLAGKPARFNCATALIEIE